MKTWRGSTVRTVALHVVMQCSRSLCWPISFLDGGMSAADFRWHYIDPVLVEMQAAGTRGDSNFLYDV